MASNVTWSDDDDSAGQCNSSRCGGGGRGVDDQRIIRVITLPIYLATFVFGLVGNTLVIYVIARCAQSSRNKGRHLGRGVCVGGVRTLPGPKTVK